ncbi:MAG: elongation factor P [Bacteroidia bacterium]|nr:elongation factor P [Bacteroidia bacterium]
MATTSDLRNGAFLRFNNELVVIEEYIHRTPGNLRAFYQVKMRSVKTGKIIENRFRSGEEITLVKLDFRKLQYIYRDDTNLVCMDVDSGEQIYVGEKLFGNGGKFLKEGMDVNVAFEEDVPVIAEIPFFVELEITYTEPAIKGDTVNNVLKAATVETGATVNVPLFIDTGEKIRIDTRTGEYMERVK